jgi:hypothetical protein
MPDHQADKCRTPKHRMLIHRTHASGRKGRKAHFLQQHHFPIAQRLRAIQSLTPPFCASTQLSNTRDTLIDLL